MSATHFSGPLIEATNKVVFAKVDPSSTPVANTASAVLAVTDMDKIQTNTGAAATIVLTMPSVTVSKNKFLTIQMTAAQIVQLVPASGEKIFLGGSGVADKYLQIAGVIGNYADLYCDGLTWYVMSYSGVLTKQA